MVAPEATKESAKPKGRTEGSWPQPSRRDILRVNEKGPSREGLGPEALKERSE
jgi:hypothetical protein